MAEITFKEYNSRIEAATTKKSFKKVGYFKAPKPDSGEFAIVRFAYNDPSEFYLQTVHVVKDAEGRWKTYSCLRESPLSPVDDCPLCKSGDKFVTKFFVKLWCYTAGSNGKFTTDAVTWSRPASFTSVLNAAVESAIESGVYEPGTKISDMVFKVRATRMSTGKGVSYTLTPVRQGLYDETECPKNFDDFKDLDFSHHDFFVKTFEELDALVNPTEEQIITVEDSALVSNAVVTDTEEKTTAEDNNTRTPRRNYF